MPSPSTANAHANSACIRCHKRKVKCSRAHTAGLELPCRSCQLTGHECTYPVRDRNITVPESILRDLEARAFGSRGQPLGVASSPELPARPLVEDTTSEVFLTRLKQIRQQNTSTGLTPRFTSPSTLTIEGETSSPESYEFVQLSFDTSDTPCTFSLPPYPYALALLDQFDIFLGHDWHWFLRKTFRKRLEQTYKNPNSSQARDRVWLCTLLVVFALGESYNVGSPLEIRLGRLNDEREPGISRNPPGTAFFEQALLLLKVRFEEPTIDQIEALNLIPKSFYSYSLSRKRTAYMYAGLSARLSNILRLHKSSTSLAASPVQAEHMKRVWWTVYCLDRMTSTEMGLPPIFRRDEVEIAYPSDELLPPESADEFSSGVSLTAQVNLAFIHTDICETVKILGHPDPMRDQKRAEPIIQRLEALRSQLPPGLSFNVEHNLSTSIREMTNRSLVSLYERYYQCFVLLLRPFFLKQINYLLTTDLANASQESLTYLTNLCLRAARTNLFLIVGLAECERLAKFGFWESLHLFSGLTILSLAISVNTCWSSTFELMPDDETTYQTAKGILDDMAQAGNLASKGQLRMLEEVEALQYAFMETDNTTFDLVNFWDVDTWMF
ncbi:uncharacterized protein N7459_005694 [Penicillium hispanicum]|uniref:uncharacterized protein n=1 Tax=Penicillium hispanicum TaxID=1080232 RepID=UPI0025400CD2|nr:uncharacterized protein N7459_005694 [Penicillium hispanicum]KAJ5579709.1 hypothetical protein N7459_005694 [Penicillium hispanicum]